MSCLREDSLRRLRSPETCTDHPRTTAESNVDGSSSLPCLQLAMEAIPEVDVANGTVLERPPDVQQLGQSLVTLLFYVVLQPNATPMQYL